MARNITSRTQQLRKRRTGTDRLDRLNFQEQYEVLAKAATEEPWLKKHTSKPYTRYALGSMQEVGADYTRISIDTAKRVENQLRTELATAGIQTDFRLQGSVPLNVHIRGVSDVDLLALDLSFFTYDTAGNWNKAGLYRIPTPKTSISVLTSLRTEAERVLKAKFPAATVDTSGGKAINISGGSLARPVDVVPAHWYDTVIYQASGMEHDRSVTILNKKIPNTIDNSPFLHIKKVGDRCDSVSGAIRKAIRLCKNVKADALEEGTEIPFPSFDIAATMYHLDASKLLLSGVYELSILAEVQNYLDRLATNHEYAKTLPVPDGSRRIFDTNDKLKGLNALSVEMDDLLREVAKEQNTLLSIYDSPPLPESRTAISSVFVG